MESWQERPAEVANLLNPAFAGAVLRLAVDGYSKESGEGMPFVLSFLVLPISLHKATSERLPSKITVYLPQWIQDNRDILITFPKRMRTLVPYTREGIVFASQRKILMFGDDGSLQAGVKKLRGIKSYSKTGLNVPMVMKRATFMGRWLAVSGSPTTLYSVLGVTP
jgi:hypothetical protein